MKTPADKIIEAILGLDPKSWQEWNDKYKKIREQNANKPQQNNIKENA